MKKHILSCHAEKKIIEKIGVSLADSTMHTDSLENSDIDNFLLRKKVVDGTSLTESIEPSDMDKLNAGNDWSKATETIESSDIDNFSKKLNGDVSFPIIRTVHN